MPKKEWIGLKIARLNDGSHRIMGLVTGSSAATSGELQIGEELSQIDDIDIVSLPTESVRVLLAGSPGSSVHLHIISLEGVGRDVCLTRIAWYKPVISW